MRSQKAIQRRQCLHKCVCVVIWHSPIKGNIAVNDKREKNKIGTTCHYKSTSYLEIHFIKEPRAKLIETHKELSSHNNNIK